MSPAVYPPHIPSGLTRGHGKRSTEQAMCVCMLFRVMCMCHRHLQHMYQCLYCMFLTSPAHVSILCCVCCWHLQNMFQYLCCMFLTSPAQVSILLLRVCCWHLQHMLLCCRYLQGMIDAYSSSWSSSSSKLQPKQELEKSQSKILDAKREVLSVSRPCTHFDGLFRLLLTKIFWCTTYEIW